MGVTHLVGLQYFLILWYTISIIMIILSILISDPGQIYSLVTDLMMFTNKYFNVDITVATNKPY